jgi:hypothetical protein
MTGTKNIIGNVKSQLLHIFSDSSGNLVWNRIEYLDQNWYPEHFFEVFYYFWSDNPSDATDTDSDKIIDIFDLDDDNDGLSDAEEGRFGSDPLLADTDGDGYNDDIDYYPLDTTKWEKENGNGQPNGNEPEGTDGEDEDDNTIQYVGTGVMVIIIILILIFLFIFLKWKKPPEPPNSTMPSKYLGNTNTKEIHDYEKKLNKCKLDKMKEEHKVWLKTESEVEYYCSDKGYNGCKWCLQKYDVD